MKLHMPVGVHLLVEFYGCTNFSFDKEVISKAIELTKCRPLKYGEHNFKPQGKSGFMILEESHISLHTYPEFGYIALDVFCCGEKAKPYEAVTYLKKHFKPMYILINEVQRGVNK